jgi:hypothetical protein
VNSASGAVPRFAKNFTLRAYQLSSWYSTFTQVTFDPLTYERWTGDGLFDALCKREAIPLPSAAFTWGVSMPAEAIKGGTSMGYPAILDFEVKL